MTVILYHIQSWWYLSFNQRIIKDKNKVGPNATNNDSVL